MAAASPVLITGLLIALVLLLMGMLLGLVLGRFPGKSEQGSLHEFHLSRLLQRMFERTDGIATDVSSHRKLLDSLKRQVHDAEQQLPTADPDFVLRLLSRVVQVNEILQQRLDRAERTLTEQAAEINAYMSEARTDTLTGLPNRRVFDDDLGRRLAEFRRHGNPLSVLVIDIDYFKGFNDCHGHLAGDAVLSKVASVLRKTLRESDLVTRLGGEEFAILLAGTDETSAIQAAERARAAVEASEFEYEGKRLQVTVSCGVAALQAGEDAKKVIKRADEALYAAKSAGRNMAFWHNGRNTLPIAAAEPTNDRPALITPARRQEFQQVCDELREKMDAIICQEA